MISHGTLTQYTNGCHCDECRAAMTFHNKKLRLNWRRRGSTLVDSEPLIRVLDYAIKAGFTLGEIERRAGLSENYLNGIRSGNRSKKMRQDYLEQVFRALEAVVAGQREALDDMMASIQYARGRKDSDSRRWPASALRERVITCYGALNNLPNGNMRRNLYRQEWLSSETADKYAAALGWTAEEVWGEEFLGGTTSEDAA